MSTSESNETSRGDFQGSEGGDGGDDGFPTAGPSFVVPAAESTTNVGNDFDDPSSWTVVGDSGGGGGGSTSNISYSAGVGGSFSSRTATGYHRGRTHGRGRQQYGRRSHYRQPPPPPSTRTRFTRLATTTTPSFQQGQEHQHQDQHSRLEGETAAVAPAAGDAWATAAGGEGLSSRIQQDNRSVGVVAGTTTLAGQEGSTNEGKSLEEQLKEEKQKVKTLSDRLEDLQRQLDVQQKLLDGTKQHVRVLEAECNAEVERNTRLQRQVTNLTSLLDGKTKFYGQSQSALSNIGRPSRRFHGLTKSYGGGADASSTAGASSGDDDGSAKGTTSSPLPITGRQVLELQEEFDRKLQLQKEQQRQQKQQQQQQIQTSKEQDHGSGTVVATSGAAVGGMTTMMDQLPPPPLVAAPSTTPPSAWDDYEPKVSSRDDDGGGLVDTKNPTATEQDVGIIDEAETSISAGAGAARPGGSSNSSTHEVPQRGVFEGRPMSDVVSPFCLYVKGIPFQMTKDDVYHYFTSRGVTGIEYMKFGTFEDSNRLKGFGHMFVKTREGCRAALALSHQQIGERYLEVLPHNKDTQALAAEGRSNSSSLPQQQQPPPPAATAAAPQQQFGPGGEHLGQQSLFMPPTTASQTQAIPQVQQQDTVFRLFVRGIPYSTTAEEFRQFFLDRGVMDIHSVEILHGDGYLFVTTDASLQKALSLHRTYFGNRYIEMMDATHTDPNFPYRSRRGSSHSTSTRSSEGYHHRNDSHQQWNNPTPVVQAVPTRSQSLPEPIGYNNGSGVGGFYGGPMNAPSIVHHPPAGHHQHQQQQFQGPVFGHIHQDQGMMFNQQQQQQHQFQTQQPGGFQAPTHLYGFVPTYAVPGGGNAYPSPTFDSMGGWPAQDSSVPFPVLTLGMPDPQHQAGATVSDVSQYQVQHSTHGTMPVDTETKHPEVESDDPPDLVGEDPPELVDEEDVPVYGLTGEPFEVSFLSQSEPQVLETTTNSGSIAEEDNASGRTSGVDSPDNEKFRALVSNLDKDVTAADLHRFFQQANISDIVGIEVLQDPMGVVSAFVSFGSEASYVSVLKTFSGKLLRGRALIFTSARAGEQRSGTSSLPSSVNAARTDDQLSSVTSVKPLHGTRNLYVGNFPNNTSIEVVAQTVAEALFERSSAETYEFPKDAIYMKANANYAFIKFKTEEEAQIVYEFAKERGLWIDGYRLRVDYKRRDHRRFRFRS